MKHATNTEIKRAAEKIADLVKNPTTALYVANRVLMDFVAHRAEEERKHAATQ